MSKSPAYQWYPKDILASQRVAMMDAKVECWYRRALDYCWVHGSVPSDAKKLAAMVGKGCTAKAAQEQIVQMFSIHPDDPEKLIHDRQEQERVKQAEWSRKSSEAGKESARRRAEAKGNHRSNQDATTVQPPLPNGTNQNPTLQSSSSSSISPSGDSAPLPSQVWPGLTDQQGWVATQLATLTGGRMANEFLATEAVKLIQKKPSPNYAYITTWANNLLQSASSSTPPSTSSAKTITTGFKNL